VQKNGCADKNEVARPAGVEPATFGSVDQRSIQLSYGRTRKEYNWDYIRVTGARQRKIYISKKSTFRRELAIRSA
jgi:hypothetical protein